MSATEKDLTKSVDEEVQTAINDVKGTKQNTNKTNYDLISNLEMLDIQMENISAILNLFRIANYNDDGLNSVNASAVDGLSTFLDLLSEKYIAPSMKALLAKGSLDE